MDTSAWKYKGTNRTAVRNTTQHMADLISVLPQKTVARYTQKYLIKAAELAPYPRATNADMVAKYRPEAGAESAR